MKNKNVYSHALRLLLAAGLLLSTLPLVFPAAQAQTFTPSLTLDITQQPTTNLPINGAPQVIKVHYVYTFREQTSSVPTAVTTSTTLHFDPPPQCAASGLLISGPNAIALAIGGSTNSAKTSYDGVATFTVLATQDAPGETPTQCTFKAYVDELNSQIQKTSTASVPATVTASYLGLLSVNVPISIDEAGPQKQINYAIDITNVGNSRSNIVFIVEDSKSTDGWNPVAPAQLLLESKAQGGTTVSKSVNFLVSTPYHNGWNNKETTFVLKIQPSSVNNQDTKGSEVSVNVLARVRGIYVPGPEPMLLLGAILGAALLVKLRKTE